MPSSNLTHPIRDESTHNTNGVSVPQPLIPRLIDQLVEKVTGKPKSINEIALAEVKQKVLHSANVRTEDNYYSKENSNKTPFEIYWHHNNIIEKQSINSSSTANRWNYNLIFRKIEKHPGLFKDLANLARNGEVTDIYIKSKSSPATKNLREESLGISEEVFNRSRLSTIDSALIYDISLAMNLAATKKTDINLAQKIASIATENASASGPIDLTNNMAQYLKFHMQKLAVAHMHAWNRSVEISLDEKEFKHPVDHAKKLTAKDIYLTPGGAWRDDLFQDANFMQKFERRKDLGILNDPAFWGTYFIDDKTIPNLSRVLYTSENKNLAALRLLSAIAEAPSNKGQTFSIDFKALDIDPNQLKLMGFDISKIDRVKIIDSSAPVRKIKHIQTSEASSPDAIAPTASSQTGMSDALEKLLQTAQTGSDRDLAQGLQALSAETPLHANLAFNDAHQPSMGLNKLR